MKRPAGAIPPLTKEGLETLIGKSFPCYGMKTGKMRWRTVVSIEYVAEHNAVFLMQKKGRMLSRKQILSDMRFDPEDPLVASVRRARFLAKLQRPES